jgi:hypothetical protein
MKPQSHANTLRPDDIALFGIFTAIGLLTIGVWLMRDLDPLGGRARIFHAFGYGLALSTLTYALPVVAQRRLASRWQGMSAYGLATASALIVAVLFVLAAVGLGSQRHFGSMWLAVTGTAGAVFVLFAFRWWRQSSNAKRAFVPLSALAFGAWLGACFWGYGMQSPAFLTKAALSQYVTSYNPAIDTFFHASLINSVNRYGTVAVGFDGLVQVPYYGLTHSLFAGLSLLGGVSALDFLNATAPILLLPLLPVSLLLFAAAAARIWPTPGPHASRVLAGVLPGIVLLALFVGVFPQPFAQNLFFQWRLALHSETYGLSVSLALLWAALLVNGVSSRLLQEGVATRSDAMMLALAALGFVLVAMTKVSTGLVVLAGISWVFLRLRLYRSFGAVGALLSGVMVVAVIAGTGVPSSSRDAVQIVPFAFLTQFVGIDRIVPFLAGCFVWPSTYLVLRSVYERRSPASANTHRVLDIEFLGVLVVAGLLPGLVFELPPKGPQSATVNSYFMDVQSWFGAGLVLALLMNRARHTNPSFSVSRRWAVRVLAGFAIGLLALGTLPNFFREFGNAAAQDRELRTLLRDRPDWRQATEATTLAGLLALGDSESGTPQRSVVAYVPQSHVGYWQMRVHGCEVLPLLSLSTAALAMIDGMPPATCKSASVQYYGYQYYRPRQTGDTTNETLTDAQLCERAVNAGFGTVLSLEGFPSSQPRRLKCPHHDTAREGSPARLNP